MTDEELLDIACSCSNCRNYAISGYIYCNQCMNGPDRKLSPELFARKQELIKKRNRKNDAIHNTNQ